MLDLIHTFKKKKKNLLGVLTRWLRTNIMEPIVSNTIVCLCLYIYIYIYSSYKYREMGTGTNDQAQPCPAKSLFIVSTKSLIEVQNEQDIVMFSIPRLLLLYDYKKLLL